jgi:hypothetical protein
MFLMLYVRVSACVCHYVLILLIEKKNIRNSCIPLLYVTFVHLLRIIILITIIVNRCEQFCLILSLYNY